MVPPALAGPTGMFQYQITINRFALQYYERGI